MGTTCIALLRGVNVGGRSVLPMVALRHFLEQAGLADVRTLLQSGNAVFRSATKSPAALEARLGRAAATGLPVATEFFVRTAAEWDALIDACPFEADARTRPTRLIVSCLKAAPAGGAVETLRAMARGDERLSLVGRALYIVYPDGIHASKLTGAAIERALGVRTTARNWNTVLKLSALAAGM